MKKSVVFFLTGLFCALTTIANTKLIHNNKFSFHPDVIVDSFWVNKDQLQEGKRGMLVHLKFTVYGMKEIDCAIAIYFLSGYEKPLKDKNQKFYTKGGDVATYSYLKPKHDETVYNDLQLFMPYDELDLDPGSYKLKMDIDLNYDDGTRLQHLRYYDFNYTQPGSSSKTISTTTVTDVAKSGLTKKEVLTKVINIVSDVLDVKPENVKMQTNFMKDLNAGHVDVAMLVMDIDEKFGVKISNAEQAEITTVQHLYDYLIKKLKISK